jgi:hypothetical protein
MEANYLVAWVPPDFSLLASGGVDVNPEGCILWLDTLDDAFVRSLRRLGFAFLTLPRDYTTATKGQRRVVGKGALAPCPPPRESLIKKVGSLLA